MKKTSIDKHMEVLDTCRNITNRSMLNEWCFNCSGITGQCQIDLIETMNMHKSEDTKMYFLYFSTSNFYNKMCIT